MNIYLKSLIVVLSIGYIFCPVNVTARAETLTEDELWKSFDDLMGVDKGWELKKEKNGIKVYVRKVDISPIKSFRGVMELDTDLSTITAFFMDSESAPDYVKLCESAEILKQVSETEMYMYSVNRPGWPVSTRDSIVHCKWCQDPETLTVIERCVGVPDFIPEKDGFVRIPLLTALVRITPRPDGKVEVIMESIAEAGGWIPNFVINMFLVDTPFHSFSKIQQMMPLDSYKGKTLKWLKELEK